jgi:hypothetical protein
VDSSASTRPRSRTGAAPGAGTSLPRTATVLPAQPCSTPPSSARNVAISVIATPTNASS